MSEAIRFREHLEELRHRLKVIFLSLTVSILIVLLLPLNPSELLNLNAVYYTTPTKVFVTRVLSDTLPSGWQIIPFHVAAPLEILIAAAFILGVAIDMPVIAYEVFRFVDPALHKEERALAYPVMASTTVLFLVGTAFGYFVLAKFIFVAMAPFYSAVGLNPPYLIEATDFYTVVFLSVFFSGLAFTTPVFVYLLIRFGVVHPSFFSKYRVWIWAGTYVATAVITPDGGPFLDVILFVPVIFLLELAVLIGKRAVVDKEDPVGARCPSCGAPVVGGELFCRSCGKAYG